MTESRGAATGRLLLCLLAAALSLWIAVRAARPPAPLPVTAPATAFSADRAMRDVRAIAMRPHPAGSVADDRVAATLAARLSALGMRVDQHRYLADEGTAKALARWSGGSVVPAEIVDVLGLLPGRDRTKPALLLIAHHDTVWGSPGAADDSMGCAAILEIVRAIRARGVPARDVMVLFTDAEETGLAGARAFWAGHGAADHVGLVLNLESRGAGGRAPMFETGAGNGDLVRLFGRAAERPLANSLMDFFYRRMPNRTDFTVAREAGLPGLNFANLGRARYYHSPLATIDRLDPATVQDIGAQALAAAGAIAFADALPARTADIVYFDLPGGYFVRYATGRGWLPILFAALLLVVAWRRLRPAGAAAAAGGAVATGWVAAHGVLLLAILDLLSGSGRAPNYYHRLAMLPRLEWQAALAVAAVFVAGFALRGARTRWLAALPALLLTLVAWRLGAPARLAWGAGIAGMALSAAMPLPASRPREQWLGAIALLILVAAIAQIVAPLVAWAWAWPALLLAGVAALGASAWLAAVAAVAVAAPMLALAHLVFLGLGATAPEIMLPFALPVFAAFWPIARIGREAAWRGAVAAVLLAAVAAGIAHRVARAPLAVTVPGYSVAR